MKLLITEWQGYGVHAASAHGALALSSSIWPNGPDFTVGAPLEERLLIEDEVLGLGSIVERLDATTRALAHLAPDTVELIAGTCACELAPISYLNARYDGNLAVLWLDAHA